MKPKPLILLYLTFFLTLLACQENWQPRHRITVIQPFEDISHLQIKAVYKRMKEVNPDIILRKAIPLPAAAYYRPRNRYRADSLIRYLSYQGSDDTVIIGLTGKDISITKGNITDWGVMGLGFCPGKACVASAFRLSKTRLTDQLYKVAVHKLGHTEGLPHCSHKTCLMRDAGGGNPLDEEKDFCHSCKSHLKSKGWQLNQ